MKKQIIVICLLLLFISFPLLIWDMKRMERDVGVISTLIVQAKSAETTEKTISFRFFNNYVVLLDESACRIIGVFQAPTLHSVDIEDNRIMNIQFRSIFGFSHELTREMLDKRIKEFDTEG